MGTQKHARRPNHYHKAGVAAFTVRVHPKLHEKLKNLALKEKRSLGAQVEYELEKIHG